MKCKKCSKELEENTKFCNSCGAKVKNDNKKLKKVLIIALILVVILVILTIIGVVIISNKIYSKKNNDNNFETYERFEEELELSAESYLLIKKYNLSEESVSNIILSDLKKENLISNKLSNKCDGYVLISSEIDDDEVEYDYDAYISCKDYKTEDYDEKYSKESNIETKTDNKINNSSNTDVYNSDHPSITSINEDEVNKKIHNSNFMTVLYYTLGSCVNSTDTINGLPACEGNQYIDKTKKYLLTDEEKISFVANLYSDEVEGDDSLYEANIGKTCYSINKFNNLMYKTFGIRLNNNQLSKYIASQNNNYVCIGTNDGMGSKSYTFTAPTEATYNNGLYTLTIDLINPEKVLNSKIYLNDYKDMVVPRNSYSNDAIYTKMYLNYKKLSDGNFVIHSINF